MISILGTSGGAELADQCDFFGGGELCGGDCGNSAELADQCDFFGGGELCGWDSGGGAERVDQCDLLCC